MRLFVAILPPPVAATELTAALGPLHRLPQAADLRWTAVEGWHFTLAFLGDVPDRIRTDLDERLARAARRHSPHELRLAGGGHFDDRALWAGAEGDLAGLIRLADTVQAAGRRAGVPHVEEHGFQPHLTLARPHKGVPIPLPPFAAALDGFRGSPWTADTLSLVSSTLPHSGVPGEQPRYDTVASWPLGHPAARTPER